MTGHLSDDFAASSPVSATADVAPSLTLDAPDRSTIESGPDSSSSIVSSQTDEPESTADASGPTHLTAYSLIKALGAKQSTLQEARQAIEHAQKNGLNLQGQNAKGLNGLHACAQIERWDLATELLERGLDPLQKPKKGASFFTLVARSETAPFEQLFAQRPDLIQRREQRKAQIEAQAIAVKKGPPVAFERLEKIQKGRPSESENGAGSPQTSKNKNKRRSSDAPLQHSVSRSELDVGSLPSSVVEGPVEREAQPEVPQWFKTPVGDTIGAQDALRAAAECARHEDVEGWESWWAQSLPQQEELEPGQTLIQTLCANADALLFALQHGLNANTRNAQGQTALMRVVEQHYQTFAAARALAGHGADFNAQDRAGNTALHRAAALGDDDGADWVEWLLAFGAQAHVNNHLGLTPAQVARQHDALEIADMLEAHLEASPPPAQVQAAAKPQWMEGNTSRASRQHRPFGQAETPAHSVVAKKKAKNPGAKKAVKKSPATSKAVGGTASGESSTRSQKTASHAHSKPKAHKNTFAAAAHPAVGTKKKKFGKKKADPIARAMDPNRTGFVSQSLSKPLREARDWYEPRVSPVGLSSAMSAPSRLPAPEITIRKRRVLGPR